MTFLPKVFPHFCLWYFLSELRGETRGRKAEQTDALPGEAAAKCDPEMRSCVTQKRQFLQLDPFLLEFYFIYACRCSVILELCEIKHHAKLFNWTSVIKLSQKVLSLLNVICKKSI